MAAAAATAAAGSLRPFAGCRPAGARAGGGGGWREWQGGADAGVHGERWGADRGGAARL